MGRHPCLIEAEEHRLGLDPVDAEADEVRHPVRGVAERCDAGECPDAVDQAVGAVPVGGGLRVEPPGLGQVVGRRAQADGTEEVLESRPSGPLLVAAEQKRPQAQTATHQQGARAERAAELRPAQREQVGPERGEVDGVVAHPLRRVDVDQHAPLAAPGHDLGHRLPAPDLVVGPLHVHQGGVGADRVEHRCGVDPTLRIHAHLGDRSRPGGRLSHGRVLDGGEDLVAATLGGAPRGHGDGLGGPAGEHHLATAGAQQRRHLVAGLLERHPRAIPSAWRRPGSPTSPPMASVMARAAAGRMGEADAWSR